MASETTTQPIARRGRAARIIIAAALSALVLVRLLPRLTDPPWPLSRPDICNLLTLILSFVALLTGWILVCFRSSYSLRVRLAIGIGSPALIVGSLVVFR